MPKRFAHILELSSRTKRAVCFFSVVTFVFIASFLQAQAPPKRPKITGIANVRIVAENDAAYKFYSKQLALGVDGTICSGVCASLLGVNAHQGIELLNRKQAESNVVNITFVTSSVEALREYVKMWGLRPSDITNSWNGKTPEFWLTDPEGHQIGFVENMEDNRFAYSESQVSKRLIHAGFIVKDPTAENHFYRDILGFHPYWHGGMNDNQTDWLDLQVPDGTDWIEFMLNVPADADKKLLGIMNHIALGVPDIHAAAKQLLTNGMKLTEEPQIGRDGKWQLNLYDPDDTRVELMEFTPAEKPCCSEYTGPHPKP